MTLDDIKPGLPSPVSFTLSPDSDGPPPEALLIRSDVVESGGLFVLAAESSEPVEISLKVDCNG